MIDKLFENISTLVIIGATILNLYLVYINYKIKTPVIDIKLDNLPTYKNEEEKTILKLKNVGTKTTKPNLEITLSCSWMPSMSMKFNLPSKAYHLAPNEEIIWKFRMDENFPMASTVHVLVKEKGILGGVWWEFTEQL